MYAIKDLKCWHNQIVKQWSIEKVILASDLRFFPVTTHERHECHEMMPFLYLYMVVFSIPEWLHVYFEWVQGLPVTVCTSS